MSNIHKGVIIMANEKYYCPDCLNELEEESGCGSVSYFCNTCKKLVSRSKMLSKNERTEGKEKE